MVGNTHPSVDPGQLYSNMGQHGWLPRASMCSTRREPPLLCMVLSCLSRGLRQKRDQLNPGCPEPACAAHTAPDVS